VFFDALRRYRKEQGRVLAYFIQEYISDGRLIRILGNNGQEQYIPLLRDHMTLENDVVVDDAPTSPNMKERVFGILAQLIPQLMQEGFPVPPEVLDYLPLPEGLVKKWKENVQQRQSQPNPEVIKMQQELQFKKESAVVDAQIEAQKVQQGNNVELVKLQTETELKRQQMEFEAQLQREKMAQEMELKRLQMAAELEIKREAGLTEIRNKASLEDARMQKVTETLSSGIGSQGKVIQEHTGQITNAFAQLLKEMRAGHGELKQVLTAPRELIRDDKGRAKGSRVVLQ